MPKPNELPESMRPLCFINAAMVRPDPDFHHDMDRLEKAVSEIGVSKAEGIKMNPAWFHFFLNLLAIFFYMMAFVPLVGGAKGSNGSELPRIAAIPFFAIGTLLLLPYLLATYKNRITNGRQIADGTLARRRVLRIVHGVIGFFIILGGIASHDSIPEMIFFILYGMFALLLVFVFGRRWDSGQDWWLIRMSLLGLSHFAFFGVIVTSLSEETGKNATLVWVCVGTISTAIFIGLSLEASWDVLRPKKGFVKHKKT